MHLIRSVHLSVAGDGYAGSIIFSVSADAAIGVDHRITCDHDIFIRAAPICAADSALGIHRTAVDLNVFGAMAAAIRVVPVIALSISANGSTTDICVHVKDLVFVFCRNGELAGADIIVFLDAGTVSISVQGVIALHFNLHIAAALNINGCHATSIRISSIRLVDGGILQLQLDQRVGEDLDDASVFSLAAALFLSAAAGRSLAEAIGGVVRGAGSSLSRSLGLRLGLALVLCFGLLPLASGSIQLPVCRGILLLLFLVIRVAVVVLIFGLGLLLRVSRSFGILLLLLFLRSGGVLCLLGLLLGRSLGRSHRLVFFLLVLLSGQRSSTGGFIGAFHHDLIIFADRRRRSVALRHGDAAFICRDHKAAIGKIKLGRKCRGGKGYRHAQGHGRRRDLPEQFFSSHDFYLPFCILWLFCRIYYPPPPYYLCNITVGQSCSTFFSKNDKKRRWPAPFVQANSVIVHVSRLKYHDGAFAAPAPPGRSKQKNTPKP